MIWFVFLLVFIVGWELAWKAAGVQPMFPWELKRRLRERPQSVALIDVRTPLEFQLFHIPGSKHRPDLLGKENPSVPADPDRDVVMICMTGHRSPVAGYGLKDQRPGRVYNLVWGMVGWKLVGGESIASRR